MSFFFSSTSTTTPSSTTPSTTKSTMTTETKESKLPLPSTFPLPRSVGRKSFTLPSVEVSTEESKSIKTESEFAITKSKSEKLGKLKCASIRIDENDKEILAIFTVVPLSMEKAFTLVNSELPFTYLAWDGERLFVDCCTRECLVDFDYNVAIPWNIKSSNYYMIAYPNLGKFMTWLDSKFVWEDENHRRVLGNLVKEAEDSMNRHFNMGGSS